MGLFNKSENQPQESRQDKLLGRFASARSTLLAVVAFTAINIVLLLTNANTYFLFSAFIPYALVEVAMALCGKFPAEYYEGLTDFEFMDSSVLIVTVVIAAVMLALYLLSWLLSKKPRVGWLIFSLVFFVLDTVMMLLWGGEDFTTVMDLLFHGWVLISLVGGISAYFKLKKLPPEQEETPAPVEEQI